MKEKMHEGPAHKKLQRNIDLRIPDVHITNASIEAMSVALRDKTRQRHEGILFLGGWIKDFQTIVTSIFIPEATTTHGSYYVSSESMIEVVNRACSLNLEIVGQLHTHPGEAYHSDGDVIGATLVRPGFISIVVPNYGAKLPELVESCIFCWNSKVGFIEIPISSINTVPHNAECRLRV